MSNTTNAIFLFVVNLGAYLIYYIVFQLDAEFSKNLELQNQSHDLEIEKLEYQFLEERIQELRREKHDMRHHIITMSEYLEAKEYDKLRAYLKEYRQSLPSEQPVVFCSHPAINVLLHYFGTQAKQHEIDFQVLLSLPDSLPLPDTDLSVLLGNLLENAIDACREQRTGMRQVIVRGKADKHTLFFTIDNTCDNVIKKDARGEFVSTKKGGSGLGIQSAKHIVDRYNGVFSAEKKGEMFYVSFMLNLN